MFNLKQCIQLLCKIVAKFFAVIGNKFEGVPNLQTQFSKIAFPTVGASLLSIASITVYFVNASVRQSTNFFPLGADFKWAKQVHLHTLIERGALGHRGQQILFWVHVLAPPLTVLAPLHMPRDVFFHVWPEVGLQ